MSRVSIYLNFNRQTEEAFTFYKMVFDNEFSGPVMRMGDVPPNPSMPALSDEDKNLVMHVALPILGGHVLIGTDILESMGHSLTVGNNVHINLEPDTREETDRLFGALKDGATIEMELQEMFWGDYYGSLTDKFGVRWMFNCTEKPA